MRPTSNTNADAAALAATIENTRTQVLRRGEKLAETANKAARLAESSRVYYENTAAIAQAAHAAAPKSSSFWASCCGKGAVSTVDTSAHASAPTQVAVARRPDASEEAAGTGIREATPSTAGETGDRSRIRARTATQAKPEVKIDEAAPATLAEAAATAGAGTSSTRKTSAALSRKLFAARIAKSTLTKKQVDTICTEMQAKLASYDTKDEKRLAQVTKFLLLLNQYRSECEKFTDLEENDHLPKGIYTQLREGLVELRNEVAEDHAKNGGFFGMGVRAKSTLESKLDECIALFPAESNADSDDDGHTAGAASTGRRSST